MGNLSRLRAGDIILLDNIKMSEREFAEGSDCVIVATSTLELGIDVGDLDHVIQIDAPNTVSSFLQRMGRTGRRSGGRRNCLFLTTDDHGFLVALSLATLWSTGWVEAVKAPALPWNVCAQQALLTTLELGSVPHVELLSHLHNCFPELPETGLDEVVTTLLQNQYLYDTGGSVLQIGAAAEQKFGRSHYRDLLATFSGSDLVVGRHGTHEIGYLDPIAFAGDPENRHVLLGGRSWRVTSVDFARRVATLEPSDQKGRAQWQGGGAVVSFNVAQAVATVLRDGPASAVQLSRRAQARLQELRESLPVPTTSHGVEQLPSDKWRVWTFLGTLANRTLLANFRTAGATSATPWYIDFAKRPPEVLHLEEDQSFLQQETLLTGYVEALKFHELLSTGQAADEAIQRCFVSKLPVGEES
jgi:ATP-dependent Lhr-like helicase